MVTSQQIEEWLQEVKDPEIPVVSLVDLGVITGVDIDDDAVTVTMTPTFAGCPAMDVMRQDVVSVLQNHGIANVETRVTFDQQWNSNRITEKGRKALKKFGLAPPPRLDAILDIDVLEQVPCPYCDSTDTTLSTPFGPTLCRSMHYCNSCKQAFEQFKPLN